MLKIDYHYVHKNFVLTNIILSIYPFWFINLSSLIFLKALSEMRLSSYFFQREIINVYHEFHYLHILNLKYMNSYMSDYM